MENNFKNKVTYFKSEQLQGIQLPGKFNYPHNYQPHPLCRMAADELKNYIKENFGTEDEFEVGKMLGVLVVQDGTGRIGYLSAFSGKLYDSNHYEKFVPPVFDRLTKDGFFKKGENELNQINQKIEKLKNHPEFIESQNELTECKIVAKNEISNFKKWMKTKKSERKAIREKQKPILHQDDYQKLEEELIRQSNSDQFKLKVLKKSWNREIDRLKNQIAEFQTQINQLKEERKQKSNHLQDLLFEQYTFVNKKGKQKSLGEIFKETVFEKPPSGAGECATPKLLQYAFLNKLKPIVFAEFWYGPSPNSEIRKHGNFYPACSGKCRPILKHMLDGTATDENPLLKELSREKQLKIIFEDETIIVISKPHNLLSVPGIEIQDSVYSRLQEKMKDCEPLTVHRLDMSTSGLMVFAKTKEAHKNLQNQFSKQTVNKRYTALLDGIPENQEGEIKLPLRPDVLDRPRQLVDYKHGKKALTLWKLVETKNGISKVHFWPKTGRTHQLRVHSAHKDGLNCPIIGDELYGKPGDRLCLHAGFLEFKHPKIDKLVSFEEAEEF
ncbi:MAG: pseudouridine synthase [Weeksellaceae bacterium]|nr:pseudouridine synthase [Weeksellaceae bacterium]